MHDSADTRRGHKPRWLSPAILGGAALLLVVALIIWFNRCVKNVDLSLPEGKLRIEFCTTEAKEQLQILLKAEENYLSKRPDDQRRADFDADYQERMRTALSYVTGDTAVMGPTNEAIERVLAPYLP